MSKNFKGYLGDQIGKLGTAVGRKWKGKMVYSAYQGKVKNPRTEEQTLVRSRFGLLGSMAASFLDATEIGFAGKADQLAMTESDYFVKKNWDTVSFDVSGSMTVDYGAITVSEGRAPWVEFNTPSFAEESEVSVTFETDKTSPKMSDDDQVYLFVYQPDSNMGVLSMPVSRDTGTITVKVPSFWSGMRVYLYGFAEGAHPETNGMTSPSTYVGNGSIA